MCKPVHRTGPGKNLVSSQRSGKWKESMRMEVTFVFRYTIILWSSGLHTVSALYCIYIYLCHPIWRSEVVLFFFIFFFQGNLVDVHVYLTFSHGKKDELDWNLQGQQRALPFCIRNDLLRCLVCVAKMGRHSINSPWFGVIKQVLSSA